MKKSLEITPGIETLYGPRDENLRLLEDGLQVNIDLRSDAVHVTGSPESLERVARVFADYDSLRKVGISGLSTGADEGAVTISETAAS